MLLLIQLVKHNILAPLTCIDPIFVKMQYHNPASLELKLHQVPFLFKEIKNRNKLCSAFFLFPKICYIRIHRFHPSNRCGSPHALAVGGSTDIFISLLVVLLLVRNMQRAILLQLDATASKIKRLENFSKLALAESNWLLSQREGCSRFMEFHHKTLSTCKEHTSFNIQIICSLIRDIWRKKCQQMKSLTVKFNVPRNCKTFRTKSKFFIELGIYPRNRIAIPIKQNRNLQRFESLINDGWICKTFGLTFDQQIVAYLSKDKSIEPRKNMLGIDINAKHFAISIISPEGKVLYQTYFGRHIYAKRIKIMNRRAKLQSLNATKKLLRLRERETNFVNTNLGQIVVEITRLAKRFNSDISIERLKKFKSIGRRANKIIMRIPFFKFKQILEQRCFDSNIILNEVDSWHTSKWCSHCGAVGDGHSSNYSLFKCKECGQIVNSDRKASLAIAVKSLLERNKHISNQNTFVQISNRRVSVNGLMRSNEIGLNLNVVHNIHPFEGKPTPFMGG